MYSVNIPIIENFNLNLYNVISVPVQINKSIFIFIQSTQDYLMVEKNKRFHIFLTQDQINKCKNIES